MVSAPLQQLPCLERLQKTISHPLVPLSPHQVLRITELLDQWTSNPQSGVSCILLRSSSTKVRTSSVVCEQNHVLGVSPIAAMCAICELETHTHIRHHCCVLTHSPHTQAFCSGGDVKSAVLRAQSGQQEEVSAFFDAEYALDLRIARCRLPYISLIDGIVMGGGAGLCMHGHFRVATDRCMRRMGLLACCVKADQ